MKKEECISLAATLETGILDSSLIQLITKVNLFYIFKNQLSNALFASKGITTDGQFLCNEAAIEFVSNLIILL